jgi:hypothetical protein
LDLRRFFNEILGKNIKSIYLRERQKPYKEVSQKAHPEII